MAALLLFAAFAGGGPKARTLFDPACPDYRLRPYSPHMFAELSKRARLRARGLDLARYRPPPDVPGARVQAQNIRHRLVPGYYYAERLEEKQEALEPLLRRVPAGRLAELLGLMVGTSPEAFLRSHGHLVPNRKEPFATQRLQALRHSERQFTSWALSAMARRINELEPLPRGAALDDLVRGLQQSDPAYRRRCARVLGEVEDALAASALERAVESETEATVLAELVQARLRHGGPRLRSVCERWARHRAEAVRVSVRRACRARKEEWLVPFLRACLARDGGRLRDETLWALQVQTGEEMPCTGGVRFYGIPTHSHRVLFCIDISGSMLFPMDGKGGQREPRINRTRRELLRAFSDLAPGTLFNVYLFADVTLARTPRLVPATSEHKEAAIAFLEEQGIRGGTNIYGVLNDALASGADTIFLLTDGEPNQGTIIDPALIIEEIAARNAHAGATIHTIGLSQDQNAELLVNLAHRNGGRYVASR
ncbi:MAG: VWA domain-containing protein [Planctomycetota bacterium]